jgi:hypothetical protein
MDFCPVKLKNAIMNKMTYYPTMFHTNPFSFNMIEFWDHSGSNTKDLILINSQATELSISKMMLNVVKVSVFNEDGHEYYLKDIPNQVEMDSKGIHTEFFIGIKSVLNVDKGNYTTFRFYLANSGNSFIYSDRSIETLTEVDYIDFEIKNGLQIIRDEDQQVALRFAFQPYTFGSSLKFIQKLFKWSRPFTGKLAGSVGA